MKVCYSSNTYPTDVMAVGGQRELQGPVIDLVLGNLHYLLKLRLSVRERQPPFLHVITRISRNQFFLS